MDILKIWEYSFEYCKTHGVTEKDIEYWNSLPCPGEVSDSKFLAETSWCIYNGGMKETVIRSKWDALTGAFWYFDIDMILEYKDTVLKSVLKHFNHPGKAKAVIESARIIKRDTPVGSKISKMTENEILDYLKTFPYIGNITKYHLGRNIGLQLVKPDRHIMRLTEYLNYESPIALVSEISKITNEKIGLIDFVLWQWLSWQGKQAYNVISTL